MSITPAMLPRIIQAVAATINENADEVTGLDQAIGDGDHVFNLQRGLEALAKQSAELALMEWAAALQKIGMILMSTVGGASGSLYGTLFVTMSKAGKDKPFDLPTVADAFAQGVDSMKLRGRSDVGEKTMLDVLVPVSDVLKAAANSSSSWSEVLQAVTDAAVTGMESTRDMEAAKGRASFLGERSKGHIDAGAKTAQLMICSIVGVLVTASTSPS